MQGLHRLNATDRTLLWCTATLFAVTFGVVAVARTGGGTVGPAEDGLLCYNSAGVGAACLPPPTGFEDVSIPSPSATAVPPPADSPSAGTTPTEKPPTKSPTVTPTVTSTVTSTTKPLTATKPAPTKPPTSEPPTVNAPPAWSAGVAYRAGAQVTYQGGVYACRQPHTSQVDWSPTATPALWSRVS